MIAVCKRVLGLFVFLLGLVGLIASIAAMVGVWSVNARLIEVTEHVFGAIDRSLVVVRQRVAQADERVGASKITTEGMERTLRDWAQRETRERVGSRFGVEEKAERLATGLKQADQWLEFSQSSVGLVQQALELGNSAGAPVETEPADRLLEELGSLRGELAQAIESVEKIRDRTSEAGDEKSLRQRVEQAAELALRVIATLGSLESRLGDLDSRLSQARTRMQELTTATVRWIRIAAAAVTLLIVWIGAGQVSLCLHGWKGMRCTFGSSDS
jgi:uncharacterized coiled-coil DUF342 family protein